MLCIVLQNGWDLIESSHEKKPQTPKRNFSSLCYIMKVTTVQVTEEDQTGFPFPIILVSYFRTSKYTERVEHNSVCISASSHLLN